MDKRKTLATTLGIVGLPTTIIPLVVGCSCDGEPEVETKIVDNTAKANRHFRVFEGEDVNKFGDFAFEGEGPIPSLDVNITINDVILREPIESHFVNNFQDRSSDQLSFYARDYVTIGEWTRGESHTLNIEITDETGNIYYKNDGRDANKAFFIQNDKDDYVIVNNSSEHECVVGVDNQGYYELGNFALTGPVGPVPNFTYSISVRDKSLPSTIDDIYFKGKFYDRSKDTLMLYINDSNASEISTWTAGEWHYLDIVIKNANTGCVCFETNEENGFIIKKGIDYDDYIITNNTTSEDERTIKVGGSGSYEFGNFELTGPDGSVPSFTYSITVDGYRTLPEPITNIHFKNNFSDRSSDTLSIDISEANASAISTWTAGEWHYLDIVIKNANTGGICYKSDETFMIKPNK
ncbi:MAG: hypothetical protein ACOQNY_01570 [Mycoplasmoidaceae bacterium]